MQTVIDQIAEVLGSYLPIFDQVSQRISQIFEAYLLKLTMGLLLLAVGLVAAVGVGALVSVVLRQLKLDKWLGKWAFGGDEGKPVKAERWISRLAFFVVMLFVLVTFFQTLELTVITQPLLLINQKLFEYAPRIIGAGILLMLAWLLASMIRIVVRKILMTSGLDQRLEDLFGAGKAKVSLAENLAATAYWLVYLLFVPALLDVLAIQGLQGPVQEMFAKVLAFLPNLVAAGLILLVGWFFARVLQRIVTNFFRVAGLEKLGEQAGISALLGRESLSGLVGLVVYILVLIPVLIASLEKLNLTAITDPATVLLKKVIGATPEIFAAVLLVLVSYFVARVVGKMAGSLLANMGLDSLSARLGFGEKPAKGEWAASGVAGTLVVAGITLLASIEALRLLGFETVAELVREVLVFAGRVIIGLIITMIGVYLANLAAKTIQASKAAQARLLATAARIAIIGLAASMALGHLGLAENIINLAFGILLGSLAVGAALAFGLGGRDVAARKLEEWLRKGRSRRA